MGAYGINWLFLTDVRIVSSYSMITVAFVHEFSLEHDFAVYLYKYYARNVMLTYKGSARRVVMTTTGGSHHLKTNDVLTSCRFRSLRQPAEENDRSQNAPVCRWECQVGNDLCVERSWCHMLCRSTCNRPLTKISLWSRLLGGVNLYQLCLSDVCSFLSATNLSGNTCVQFPSTTTACATLS